MNSTKAKARSLRAGSERRAPSSVYRHHPIAILAFWLLTMLITAELYQGMSGHLLPIPT